LFSQPKLTGIGRRRFLQYAHLLIGRRAFGFGHLLRQIVIAPGLRVDTIETASAHGTYCPPPVELLVNGVRNPLAVDNDALRLTWMIPLAGRRQIQAAYRILVSSSPKLLANGHADQWDSGKVDSAQSSAVLYRGAPVVAGSRYWWRVCVWDEMGRCSDYSQVATFDIGLSPTDWKAKFIWDGTVAQNHFTYLRKELSLSAKPRSARVFVSAHNDYLLFLNGVCLGMGPARSDPFRFGQYNTYDISDKLTEGVNVFAAISHWLGTWNDSGINARPAFILEARMILNDGTDTSVLTDETWKVAPRTPFLESNPSYFGQAGGQKNRAAIQYDARLEPEGWTRRDYNDSEWPTASVVDCSDYNLHAQLVAPQAEQAELQPTSIRQEDTAWFVDFGRCLDGWFQLVMRNNQPGDIVKVEYFQLEGQGGPAGWDQYTCKGGVETWRPNIGRHASFRTLRITGYTGTLAQADVYAVWAYTTAEPRGGFSCSSTLLNDIFTMSERTARQNIQQGIVSVDANREQSPWLADSWIVGNVLLYNHKNTMVVDKIIRDYAAEQLSIGDFYACSPAAIYRIPEWSMYWPMLLWQQYLFSGDQQLLQTHYHNLTAFLTWIQQYQDKKTGLIDPEMKAPDRNWRISDYAGGSLPSGGYNIATNCQFYENVRIASEVATILGNADEAKSFIEQSKIVKKGINQYLFSGTYYYSRTDKNDHHALASAWALRFNLVPENALAGVVDFIRASGLVSIGGYGGDAFYSGMLSSRQAGGFVVQDLDRYKKMLLGNDATWETFNEPGAEYNHAWTSYPAYLFHKYICGIQPTGGGFSTFEIRPDVSGLTWAKSEIPTVKGTLRTGWEKPDAATVILTAEIPPNSRARIHIAKLGRSGTRISEAGHIIWKNHSFTPRDGISSAVETPHYIVLEVYSGQYRFTIR
jgi:alpha-L-rhamnosidase